MPNEFKYSDPNLFKALTLNSLTLRSILNADPGALTVIVSFAEYPAPLLMTITSTNFPPEITGFSFTPVPVLLFTIKSGFEKNSLPVVSTTTSIILPLIITGLTEPSFPCFTVTAGLL